MGNANLVEQMTELWATGQLHRFDEYLDAEIEWLEPPETIGRNVVTGPEAALGALANWGEQFDSLRVETTDLREEGDRVLHGMRQFARARGSAVDIEGDLYMVWWFRNGKAVRMEMYNTLDQAEEAFAR
jgi:ketosteroid isomerase-like protein